MTPRKEANGLVASRCGRAAGTPKAQSAVGKVNAPSKVESMRTAASGTPTRGLHSRYCNGGRTAAKPAYRPMYHPVLALAGKRTITRANV